MLDDQVYSRFQSNCELLLSNLSNEKELKRIVSEMKWPKNRGNGVKNDYALIGVLTNDIKSSYRQSNREIFITVLNACNTIINYISDRQHHDDMLKDVALSYIQLKSCWNKMYDHRYYIDLCMLNIPQTICTSARTKNIIYKYI